MEEKPSECPLWIVHRWIAPKFEKKEPSGLEILRMKFGLHGLKVLDSGVVTNASGERMGTIDITSIKFDGDALDYKFCPVQPIEFIEIGVVIGGKDAGS